MVRTRRQVLQAGAATSAMVEGASFGMCVDMTGEPESESLVVDGHYGPNLAYELVRFSYSDAASPEDRPGAPPTPLVPNPIAEPDLTSAERHRLVIEGSGMMGAIDVL